MKPIEFNILGASAWGKTFRNWQELQNIFISGEEHEHGEKGPKPEIIPANERRRAPLPVKLAVETSWQAVQQANLDASLLTSVFVSGVGDTQLTDYMCKALAGENKALSPTKFHNSVHNAAAGYWTISTKCMQAANSVAGYQHSVGLSLLEALIQSETESKPVLITAYDAPCSTVLEEVLHNDVAFSASIIIAPTRLGLKGYFDKSFSAQLLYKENDSLAKQCCVLSASETLEHYYKVNPSAKILPLLKMLAKNEDQDTNLQLNGDNLLRLCTHL